MRQLEVARPARRTSGIGNPGLPRPGTRWQVALPVALALALAVPEPLALAVTPSRPRVPVVYYRNYCSLSSLLVTLHWHDAVSLPHWQS